ncbi:MAG: monovalent cation/H(+) antiporter subunit G [Acidobacteriota bacterium]
MTWLDAVGGTSVVVGALFCLIGAWGILVFPDVYCRAHATSVTDTLGAGLVLVGLALCAAHWTVVLKLVAIFAFLLITGPASEHALMRAAYHGGVRAKVEDAWVSPSLDEPLVEDPIAGFLQDDDTDPDEPSSTAETSDREAGE